MRVQGYYTFDGFVHVQPPMKRAILEAVDALRKAGHEGKFQSRNSPHYY